MLIEVFIGPTTQFLRNKLSRLLHESLPGQMLGTERALRFLLLIILVRYRRSTTTQGDGIEPSGDELNFTLKETVAASSFAGALDPE